VYVAVADHIAARIAAGEPAAGARLRAERDLAKEYGVAYLTVRRAAGVLRERGLILTVHGKGTFVADPLPEGDWGVLRKPHHCATTSAHSPRTAHSGE
jgi:DNA-binding GntR family transcriptional regulator